MCVADERPWLYNVPGRYHPRTGYRQGQERRQKVTWSKRVIAFLIESVLTPISVPLSLSSQICAAATAAAGAGASAVGGRCRALPPLSSSSSPPPCCPLPIPHAASISLWSSQRPNPIRHPPEGSTPSCTSSAAGRCWSCTSSAVGRGWSSSF